MISGYWKSGSTFSCFSLETMEVTPKEWKQMVQSFTSRGASHCNHETFSFKPRDKNLAASPNSQRRFYHSSDFDSISSRCLATTNENTAELKLRRVLRHCVQEPPYTPFCDKCPDT